ncbi:dead deah box rna helicase [Plasmopara halstedii]|uniref:Dead deah box rna helicase n=1 Tax=Plasmopara halstedii TaxID=4781 RepID=A0A0P1AM19_PLAHL|nr:dead deah box rna helicase [Plasmopara halstedii]CEG41946.1 dead deah box rna helicase [Plasmopara halstedii]|eukprot:XP_024578315.1 dead deah box rna helicase [Plasmopara halstedii]
MEETTPPRDAAEQTTLAPPTPTASTSHKLSVYSRLYDPKSYTGVYKKRFEDECNDLSELVVHDLSNTTRTNLNHDVSRTKQRMTSIPNIVNSSSLRNCAAPSTIIAPVINPTSTSPVKEKIYGDPNDPHTLLKTVFHYYCRFGRTGPKGLGEKTLDNSNFVKLCRDCPDLLDDLFGQTDVDLIFVKVKKKGERRINYTRFLDALGMIAVQKYGDMPLEASVPKLLEAHLAHLHCLLEFTDGKTVQAVWQNRTHHNEKNIVDEVSPPVCQIGRQVDDTITDQTFS